MPMTVSLPLLVVTQASWSQTERGRGCEGDGILGTTKDAMNGTLGITGSCCGSYLLACFIKLRGLV